MQIFAGVWEIWGVKQESGRLRCRFSYLSLAIFSKSSSPRLKSATHSICVKLLHKHDKLTQCCRAFTLALARLSCHQRDVATCMLCGYISSVCACVCQMPVFYRNSCVDQGGFYIQASLDLSYIVIKENTPRVSPKIRTLPSGTLSQTVELATACTSSPSAINKR